MKRINHPTTGDKIFYYIMDYLPTVVWIIIKVAFSLSFSTLILGVIFITLIEFCGVVRGRYLQGLEAEEEKKNLHFPA